MDSASSISKILGVFVTATDLAAAATQATYLEAATAELQNRFQREWGSRLESENIKVLTSNMSSASVHRPR